jgi:hypothetical protein
MLSATLSVALSEMLKSEKKLKKGSGYRHQASGLVLMPGPG